MTHLPQRKCSDGHDFWVDVSGIYKARHWSSIVEVLPSNVLIPNPALSIHLALDSSCSSSRSTSSRTQPSSATP